MRALEHGDERQEELAVEAVEVEFVGRAVGGRHQRDAALEEGLEQAPENHGVGDVGDLELVETQQPRLARQEPGHGADGVIAVGLPPQRQAETRTAFGRIAAAPDGDEGVDLAHEGVEMDPALGRERRGVEEYVHEHGLPATHRTPQIDAFGRPLARRSGRLDGRRPARLPGAKERRGRGLDRDRAGWRRPPGVGHRRRAEDPASRARYRGTPVGTTLVPPGFPRVALALGGKGQACCRAWLPSLMRSPWRPERPGRAITSSTSLIAERAPRLAAHPAWPLVRPLLYLLLDYAKARRLADDIAPLPRTRGPGAGLSPADASRSRSAASSRVPRQRAAGRGLQPSRPASPTAWRYGTR